MKKNGIIALCLAVIITLLSFASISCSGDTSASLVYGDANGNGKVDAGDASHILQYDVKLINSVNNTKAADVTGDGNINSADAASVLQYDVKLIDRFPAESVSETESSAEASSEEPPAEESSAEESSVEESRVEYPEGAYIVKRVSGYDISWDSVPKAEISTYKWVDSVEYEAYAQLVYVEGEGFVCKMTCLESDPLAVYTQYGDPVYLDSCMEFFAAWDNVSYVNMESNSLGTLCAQFGKTKKNRKDLTEYFAMNEIFTVTPSVEEDCWTLTMEFPIEKLRRLYPTLSAATFESGYTFKGNFYKIGSDPTDGTRHYGMWNEVGTASPDFHQPSYFGTFVIE